MEIERVVFKEGGIMIEHNVKSSLHWEKDNCSFEEDGEWVLVHAKTKTHKVHGSHIKQVDYKDEKTVTKTTK